MDRTQRNVSTKGVAHGGDWVHYVSGIVLVTLLLFAATGADADDESDENKGEKCSKTYIYENDQMLTDRNYTFGFLKIWSCISEEGNGLTDSNANIFRKWNRRVLGSVLYNFNVSGTKYRGTGVLHFAFYPVTPEPRQP